MLQQLSRVGHLVRPPLAIWDQLAWFHRDPAPNAFVLDNLIAIAEYQKD